jgi:hypothetical protein
MREELLFSPMAMREISFWDSKSFWQMVGSGTGWENYEKTNDGFIS